MTQQIPGTNNNDLLTGTHGNDTFLGSLGDDTIIGNGGHDTVDYSNLHQPITITTHGTVLKDSHQQDSLSGIETIIGAAGQPNAIDASGGTGSTSVDVDLGQKRLTVNNIPHVGNVDYTVKNFVNVIGTSQADSIIGNAQDNNLQGGDGSDTIKGNAGNDTIDGGGGNDSLSGGTDDDTLTGGDGNDTINGNGGNDVVDGGRGHDFVIGGTDNDMLQGGDGNDTVIGREGDDTVVGAGGNDSLEGSAGDDMLKGGLGEDILKGGEGNDSVWGGEDNDTIQGNGGDDFLEDIHGDDCILGGDGDDTVYAGKGNDVIDGEGGEDLIFAGADNDTVVGGAGNDIIEGGAGDDAIYGDNYIPQSELVGSNLVENGSFEHNSVRYGSAGVFNSIPGWNTTFGSGIEVKEQGHYFGAAADGHAWVELDSYSNSGMAQHIDTNEGSTYQLSVDYTPRQYVSPSKVEVWWDGEHITTLSGHGGHQSNWDTYTFEVEGGHGDTTKLEFRAAGHSNGLGGFIDNIKVFETSEDPLAHKLTTEKVAGDDELKGGDGNDSLYGGAGSDTLYGGAGDDVLAGTDGHTTGLDQEDRLNGGAGRDTFVLANGEGGFYNNQYWHDCVIVEDLNTHEDTVQLSEDAHYWLGNWGGDSYLYEYANGHWDGVAVFEDVQLNNHDLQSNEVFEYV